MKTTADEQNGRYVVTVLNLLRNTKYYTTDDDDIV